MLSTVFGGGPANSGNETFGFRVAYVPEPTSVALLGALAPWAYSYSIAIGGVEKQEIIHALQILELGKASRTLRLAFREATVPSAQENGAVQAAFLPSGAVRPAAPNRGIGCASDADRVLLGPASGHYHVYLGHGKRLLDDNAQYPKQPHDVAKHYYRQSERRDYSVSKRVTMTVSGSVSPAAVDFVFGGPYTITGERCRCNRCITIDTEANSNAEIDSTIAGSNYEMTTVNPGQLTLGGSVTTAGIAGGRRHAGAERIHDDHQRRQPQPGDRAARRERRDDHRHRPVGAASANGQRAAKFHLRQLVGDRAPIWTAAERL